MVDLSIVALVYQIYIYNIYIYPLKNGGFKPTEIGGLVAGISGQGGGVWQFFWYPQPSFILLATYTE